MGIDIHITAFLPSRHASTFRSSAFWSRAALFYELMQIHLMMDVYGTCKEYHNRTRRTSIECDTLPCRLLTKHGSYCMLSAEADRTKMATKTKTPLTWSIFNVSFTYYTIYVCIHSFAFMSRYISASFTFAHTYTQATAWTQTRSHFYAKC